MAYTLANGLEPALFSVFATLLLVVLVGSLGKTRI
jgi:hypothetical protein